MEHTYQYLGGFDVATRTLVIMVKEVLTQIPLSNKI
jgi:hypothetical protein